MNKITTTAAALALGGFLAIPAAGQEAQDGECGSLSIAQMGWASAEIMTEVAKFLLEQGYGCQIDIVKSDTIPPSPRSPRMESRTSSRTCG